jgi:ABC-type nickel/cobalt efflux system permease component RcnA
MVIAIGVGYLVTPIISLIVGVVVAFAKEVYDYFESKKHTCDGLDAISTIVGVLVGLELLLQLKVLL